MRALPLALALLLAGCDVFAGGPAAELRTSADAYVAEVGDVWIRFEVPLTVENTGGETIELTGCSRPDPPSVEKHVDGAWTPAYIPVVMLCLAEPVPVAPGRTFRYTFEAAAAWPDRSAVPEWRTGAVPGTYRLRWQAGTVDGGLDLVSNPFRLAVR